MADITELPIDRAQLCASHLHAIDDLLTTAADGGSGNMHLVDPSHLAMLISSIVHELDGALEALAKQITPARLHAVTTEDAS